MTPTSSAALIALGLVGGCGAGHVHRGVHKQAVVDLDCPPGEVEIESLDSAHERFRATGCDREASYAWVDGKPVRDEP